MSEFGRCELRSVQDPRVVHAMGRRPGTVKSGHFLAVMEIVDCFLLVFFHFCRALKSIRLPKGLEIIGDSAFFDSGLEKVTLPVHVQIHSYAFSECDSLRTVRVNGKESSLTIADTTFANCPELHRAPQNVCAGPDRRPSFFEILASRLGFLKTATA